jgi:uncharacterized damage-inducible protein DinB
MIPRVTPFAQMFKFDAGFLKKQLEGISDSDLHKRINNAGSSIHWIVGHITASRTQICQLIGAKAEFKHSDLFKGDGKDLQDPSAYPAISELFKSFDSATRKLNKRLGELTEKDLKKEGKGKWPQGGKTMLDGITFMCWHEGWHLGQIAYLKKRLGHKSLAG